MSQVWRSLVGLPLTAFSPPGPSLGVAHRRETKINDMQRNVVNQAPTPEDRRTTPVSAEHAFTTRSSIKTSLNTTVLSPICFHTQASTISLPLQPISPDVRAHAFRSMRCYGLRGAFHGVLHIIIGKFAGWSYCCRGACASTRTGRLPAECRGAHPAPLALSLRRQRVGYSGYAGTLEQQFEETGTGMQFKETGTGMEMVTGND